MFTKEMMDTFTDLDLAVYDCIVKNRGRISRMPIKELAAMAHVSTATILRFCRKCGADGYSEFKIKYREHLEGKRDALKDDGTAELQSFVNQAWSEDFQESIEMAFQYLFINVTGAGLTIVMNPVLAFPFIAMPVISCILQYVALYTGLCPLYGATQVPWTCPPIISGFLIGGWRTALLQLVIFIMTTGKKKGIQI